MIYYLSRDYKSNRINDAGSKARLDVEQVMDQLGFSPAGKRHSITKNRLFHFVRTIAIVVRMLLYVNKGDVLIYNILRNIILLFAAWLICVEQM